MNEPGERGDYRNILSGTAQNVLGILVAGIATLASQVLISRVLGAESFGLVTVMTQATNVASFATRAGMDMAVLQKVAVESGASRADRIASTVTTGAILAASVSAIVGIAAVLAAGPLTRLLSIASSGSRGLVAAAAIGLPFLALTHVWLGATRGLKIMRYTLYVFWAGQPIVWIVLMVLGWGLSQSETMTVFAYGLSWACAAAAAFYFWRRESAARGFTAGRLEDFRRLLRYAGLRAPAALFSHLLFWTDLFVVTRYVSDLEVGIYSAALRAGQVVVLFLTSLSLMFGPYVADLYERGERARLDRLFKNLTRWTLAVTLPVFLVFAAVPDSVLRIFGGGFDEAGAALLILLAGQLLNIATGSVGFVLIMVNRTGWDLVIYAGSFALDIALAFWLCPRYGIEGAAIANAVTFGVSNLVRLVLVARFVGIQPYDRNYGRLLLPAAAGFGAMWLIHQATESVWWATDLVSVSLGGVAVYAVALLLRGLTPEERGEIKRVLVHAQAR